ncbi:putative nucleic-acid-binding Zn-ribbon protein [Peribacillus simplex]|nr:putative nucleic-acid-binding Zn-ribbon protein [Peribacillus simplex]
MININEELIIRKVTFLENTCSKCKTVMVEAKLDSFPIRIYKSGEKPNVNTMSSISPCFVCPNCGFIELYVKELEKFNSI